jgi:hypothetical protein
MFKPADLFDLSQTEHAAIFDGCKFTWDALKKIEGYIAANLKPARHNPAMRDEGRAFIGEKVFIGKDTVVEDGEFKGRLLRDSHQSTLMLFRRVFGGSW